MYSRGSDSGSAIAPLAKCTENLRKKRTLRATGLTPGPPTPGFFCLSATQNMT